MGYRVRVRIPIPRFIVDVVGFLIILALVATWNETAGWILLAFGVFAIVYRILNFIYRLFVPEGSRRRRRRRTAPRRSSYGRPRSTNAVSYREAQRQAAVQKQQAVSNHIRTMEQTVSEYNRELSEHMGMLQGILRSPMPRFDIDASNGGMLERNEKIEKLKIDYEKGRPQAIADYASLVIVNCSVTKALLGPIQLSYSVKGKELIVEYGLPQVDIVPTISEYRYVKSRNDISTTKRDQTGINQIYKDCVAAIALRVMQALFITDINDLLGSVVFNGYIEDKIYMISVKATKQAFLEYGLRGRGSQTCIKDLNGRISRSTIGKTSIRPIRELKVSMAE